ncbi:MAG: hypothetical protein LBH90_05750 [Tannerella sp.]|jgi:hypothetical protein|nr:hypothetical protein [Tannerella sp.]
MKNSQSKLFLYTGLGLLFLAVVLRWRGFPFVFWFPAFFMAIALKAVFLFHLFRSKEFKLTLWLILILTGIMLILVSLLFKYVFYIPALRQILFFGAIFLKVSGLTLMLIHKSRIKKQ